MKYDSFSERLWWQVAVALLALIPIFLVAQVLDARTVNDISVWIKPQKFSVSLGLHFVTLAILASLFADKVRRSWWMIGLAVSSVVAVIAEQFIMTFQSARGVASHFNFETQLDQILYALMGLGALLLIFPALIMGFRFLFAPTSEKLTPGLKMGAALGLILGYFLTLGLAGYMSSFTDGHWVGGVRSDANGLPIFGWARDGGDLRVAHFFATHLMQAVPLAGYLADRTFGSESAMPKIIAIVAALAGAAITVGTFLQDMAGEPFLGFLGG